MSLRSRYYEWRFFRDLKRAAKDPSIDNARLVPLRYAGAIRFGASGDSYCPITAVARLRRGRFYDVGDWFLAGQAIGLSGLHAESIIRAADGAHTGDPGLRHRLLAAVGLQP